MRTTLTLLPDVASLLRRVRRRNRDASLKDVVNEALRRGLTSMLEPGPEVRAFETDSVSLGGSRLADVDDIAEALAAAEGEAFR